MRCVPIIFGVNISKYPIFFGAFYKFSYYCSINNWPIIAQEDYFKEPNYFKKTLGMNLDEVSLINEIPNLNKINYNSIDKYLITNEETDAVIKNYKDKDEAWIKLMNNKDNTLFEILDSKLSLIMKKYDDIKYLVVWRHNDTISQLANKYNLKVLEMELSGVRKKSYNFGLCYYQFSNKYSDKELKERYFRFKEEIKNRKVPILSREELIRLLVTTNEINNLCEAEEFEIGVALGLRNDYETFSTESITNDEILKQLLKHSKGSSILIRKHPANYNYKYPYENRFILDKSVSSIQFLSRCKKIVSSVSNIGLEAMLFGKTSYTLGKMPFKMFCYDSLDINDSYVISAIDLNFLIFCYYVPYSLALTQEYMEFRMNAKNECDIYMYHYNYIMDKYKINRKIKLKQFYINRSEIDKLKIENNDLKDQLGKMTYENNQMREELNSMLSSKSWKITKPLRIISKRRRK